MAEITIPSGETVLLDNNYVYGYTNTTQDATNGEILTIAISTAFSQVNSSLTIETVSLVSSLSHTQTTYGSSSSGSSGSSSSSTTGENWRN